MFCQSESLCWRFNSIIGIFNSEWRRLKCELLRSPKPKMDGGLKLVLVVRVVYSNFPTVHISQSMNLEFSESKCKQYCLFINACAHWSGKSRPKWVNAFVYFGTSGIARRLFHQSRHFCHRHTHTNTHTLANAQNTKMVDKLPINDRNVVAMASQWANYDELRINLHKHDLNSIFEVPFGKCHFIKTEPHIFPMTKTQFAAKLFEWFYENPCTIASQHLAEIEITFLFHHMSKPDILIANRDDILRTSAAVPASWVTVHSTPAIELISNEKKSLRQIYSGWTQR